MRDRLTYWRRSRDFVGPFVMIIYFVLITNALVILSWTTIATGGDDRTARDDRNTADARAWGFEEFYHRRLRFPSRSGAGEADKAHRDDAANRAPTNFSGVVPRAFDRATLTCLPAESRWFGQHVLTSRTTTGFLFNKPFKTGSSTAVGVHLRIAKNLAKRQLRNVHESTVRNSTTADAQGDTLSSSSASPFDYSMCQTRFDHGLARDLFPHRDQTRSFLWTTLRDPTARAVSQFFHFMVARHKVEPTDANFRTSLDHGAVMARDYYLYILSTSPGYTSRTDDEPRASAQAVLDGYDFVAVTERMAESLVALQLLLGLPTADLLYLSAKHHGHFDDGAGKRRCYYIWPSFVTPGMRDYFASEAWQGTIQWDLALYRAANRSLDLTIDRLGRPAFETALRRFQTAQAVAHERCLAEAVFPCSDGGQWRPPNETNCIWNDSGCGNDCLDKVADELGLWETIIE